MALGLSPVNVFFFPLKDSSVLIFQLFFNKKHLILYLKPLLPLLFHFGDFSHLWLLFNVNTATNSLIKCGTVPFFLSLQTALFKNCTAVKSDVSLTYHTFSIV